jgi:hypothetical protein
MSPEQKMAFAEFRQAARAQRCCCNPDCEQPMAHPWDPHHVVYEQELERRGVPLFDARNVLRLCRTCHFRHHQGIAPIPMAVLTPANLAYAREVLGDFYIDYLNRRYVPECPI